MHSPYFSSNKEGDRVYYIGILDRKEGIMRVVQLFAVALAAPLTYCFATMTFGGGAAFTPDRQLPGSNPPEVSLSMEGTGELHYGDEAVVHYQVFANDGQGYSSDAYLGIVLPNGRIFYLNGRNQLTEERTAIRGNMIVEDVEGTISFGSIPGGAPPGLYTIYGTLTYVGKDPLKNSDRISNLGNTQFILIAPPPTNTPVPPAVPTPTPMIGIVAAFEWDPDPGVVGEDVEFRDKSTTSDPPIVSWSWTFENGDPSSANSKGPHNVTWDNVGDYSVTLEVVDNAGKMDSTSESVTVGVGE
jgi:hypothetical protein